MCAGQDDASPMECFQVAYHNVSDSCKACMSTSLVDVNLDEDDGLTQEVFVELA